MNNLEGIHGLKVIALDPTERGAFQGKKQSLRVLTNVKIPILSQPNHQGINK